MKELVCKKCGTIVYDGEAVLTEIPLAAGGKHIKASCPGCLAYLKFVPQYIGPPKFYFGKYKGKTVEEVADVDMEYLRWAFKNGIGGDKIVRAINEILCKTIRGC